MAKRTIRIRSVHPPDSVTTRRSDAEVPAEAVDLPHDAVERIWRAVEALYLTGVNPAIAMCVRRHGQVVLDRAIGHARGNGPDDLPGAPTVLATPDTPFCIFSASKAITAMVMHLLDDKGTIHIGDRISEYIPRFAKHGKHWITIRDILSHRAGIPSIGGEADLELLADHDAIVDRLCEARVFPTNRRQLAYHAISGGFVLDAIVRQTTGKTIREVLAEEILDPLGFDGMNYGWHPDRLDELAENAFTGRRPGFPIRGVAKRALGVDIDRAPAIANTALWNTSIVPSGNICATANEASRFFQLLLNEGELDGQRIFEGRTIRRAVTETSYLEMDLTLMLPVRYGVGLMLGSKHLGVFGPRTERAFGHLGMTNVFCWADPARRISVALLTSGKPVVSSHLISLVRLLRTISRSVPEVV